MAASGVGAVASPFGGALGRRAREWGRRFRLQKSLENCRQREICERFWSGSDFTHPDVVRGLSSRLFCRDDIMPEKGRSVSPLIIKRDPKSDESRLADASEKNKNTETVVIEKFVIVLSDSIRE